jgi:hypothetical protein
VEAPHLQRLHKRYFGQGLRLVAVTQMNPTLSEVRQFTRRHGVTYPVVLDPGERTGKRYRIEGHPCAVLLDRRGVVRFVHTGFLPGDEKLLETAIQAVLAGRTPPKGDD